MYNEIFSQITNAANKRNLRDSTIHAYCTSVAHFLKYTDKQIDALTTQWKEKTVPGEEFIRRFLMHVPPKRFVRIRHYGLLSCRNKSKKMAHCRNLLGCKKYISALKNRSAAEMIKLLYNIDVCRCSSCGGKMVPHLPDRHTPSVLAHMRC